MNASIDDPPRQRWTIAPLQIQGALAAVEVPGEGLTLGRDADNPIALSREAYPGVSGRHARLTVVRDELFLEDLNSKNGTLVAGRLIRRERLRHGDVFELGTNGPRFAALFSTPTDDTLEIPRSLIDQHKTEHSVGTDTMRIVRERLGVPEDTKVSELVERRTRRNSLVLLAVTLLLIGGGAAGYLSLQSRGTRVVDDLRAQADAFQLLLDQQASQASEARLQIDQQREAWRQQARELEAARESWAADKQRLIEQRQALEAGIHRLESDERAASDELARLRDRLEQTSAELKLYDPLALEEARLDRVGEVERAVVLIDVTLIFKSEQTGQTLYVATQADGSLDVNFEGRGAPLMTESSGSGFCVDPEGWILTNAHVVHKKDEEESSIEISENFTLLPELQLEVVFSGSSTRHPARLVSWAGEGTDDLALIKIEPFPGLPHLDGIDLTLEPPPRGADVFLIGFPLGRRALQQGDQVIASTFRGIVSREVEPYLQVDAAVHPGASGGPVIDGHGRILGVVTAMQAVGRVAGSSSIGYIIPIAKAASIWPPPAPAEAEPTTRSD